MAARFNRVLKRLQRGYVSHGVSSAHPPYPVTENLTQQLQPPLGTLKKAHLIAICTCLVGLEVGLLWNGIVTRQSGQVIDYTAAKVGVIMKMYHCQDERIYQAIMNTFNPVLVATVIGIESDYQIDAVSRRGCRGLMQLAPNKLANWKDPVANIECGAAYLESLVKRFRRVDLALAAYNAGPGAIYRFGGIPPYRETQIHLAKAKIIGLKRCWPLINPLITGLSFSLNG